MGANESTICGGCGCKTCFNKEKMEECAYPVFSINKVFY